MESKLYDTIEMTFEKKMEDFFVMKVNTGINDFRGNKLVLAQYREIFCLFYLQSECCDGDKCNEKVGQLSKKADKEDGRR